jgi:hypothetical protein
VGLLSTQNMFGQRREGALYLGKYQVHSDNQDGMVLSGLRLGVLPTFFKVK